MNTKSTLVVVAIAVLLGAYVFVFERGKAPEMGQAGYLPKVLGYNADGVWKVQIERKEGALWLTRDKGGTAQSWKLEKPVSALADADQVTELVKGINDTVVDQVIREKGKDLKPFGLDAPSFELTLATEDGGSRTLLVGGRTPGGESVYLKPKSGSEIYVASPMGIDGLQAKKADDLRDKTIMSFTRDDVQRIELAAKGQTLRVENTGKDAWQLTAPVKAKAKTAKVDSILMSFEALKGSKVVEDNAKDLNKYGLGTPQATVSVWVKGENEPRVCLLGNKQTSGEVYAKAKNNPTVFSIYSYSNALNDAQTPVDELKDGPKPAAKTPPPPVTPVQPNLTPATGTTPPAAPAANPPAAVPAKPAAAPAAPAKPMAVPVKPVATPAKPAAHPAAAHPAAAKHAWVKHAAHPAAAAKPAAAPAAPVAQPAAPVAKP